MFIQVSTLRKKKLISDKFFVVRIQFEYNIKIMQAIMRGINFV
jgi:hypothetical protein